MFTKLKNVPVDQVDAIPDGVMATSPELLHIGDELLTDNGWQTVLGIYRGKGVDGGPEDDQVTVFTAERDIASDGWPCEPEDLVQIRRNILGSCVIQFVEPFPAVGGTK